MDFIGFDLGTSSIKAVRWNRQDGIVAKSSRKAPMQYPAENQVEMDAEEYLSLVTDILAELAAVPGEPIAAIAMAAASGNTVLCSPEDSKPLTPIISWLDKRLDWRPPSDWNTRETSGWPCGGTFPLMHLEYFRRTCPELLDSARIAMSNDLITWRLTGKHVLDYSSGTPFYLINQKERRYEKKYLEHYGITEDRLPSLADTGTPVGRLLPRYVTGCLTPETIVAAGSFDHPAAALASGVTQYGDILLSCGTSWVVFAPVPNRDTVPLSELADPFLSASGGCWGAISSLAYIGIEIDKFVHDHFGEDSGCYARFEEESKDKNSPAAAFMLDVVTRFKAKTKNHHIERAVMTGGPSNSPTWIRYMEEELNIKITTSPYHDHAGSVGAAMIAERAVHQS